MPKQRDSGATLLELVAVLGIITILVSLLMPAMFNSKRAAQKAACKANARNIELLNKVGVPVVYPKKYDDHTSIFEGSRGYVEIDYPYHRKQLILFVNCFDCHDITDPWEPVYEFVTVY